MIKIPAHLKNKEDFRKFDYSQRQLILVVPDIVKSIEMSVMNEISKADHGMKSGKFNIINFSLKSRSAFGELTTGLFAIDNKHNA